MDALTECLRTVFKTVARHRGDEVVKSHHLVDGTVMILVLKMNVFVHSD